MALRIAHQICGYFVGRQSVGRTQFINRGDQVVGTGGLGMGRLSSRQRQEQQGQNEQGG